jgi:hypothetical protein
MDTIFIWLIAGAAIGLLGVFLIASERELKSKRQELEQLKHLLADNPTPVFSNAATDVFPQDNGASAELMARNRDLLEEVSSLSQKLETSESRLEQMETLRAHLNSKESEITELRWECERLQSQVTALKTPAEPAPDASSSNSEKDAEIAALKQQLEASEAKVRNLESTPVQLADGESHQKAIEELQRSLEVSNLQRQNALAADQEKQKAMDAMQMQLLDAQQRHHELSETNARLQDENSQYQQKLTNQGQFQVERLVILRQRLEALQSKQAEVSEQHRLIQEEVVSISQLLDVAPESTYRSEPSNGMYEDRHNLFEVKGENSEEPVYPDMMERSSLEAPAAEHHTLHNDNFNDSFNQTTETSTEADPYHPTSLPAAVNGGAVASELSRPGLTKKKRRFGIFSAAVGALVFGGALAANFLVRESEQKPSDSPTPSSLSSAAKMKSPPAAMVPESKETRSMDKTVKGTTAMAPTAATADQARPPVVASSRGPSPTAWESYEIIQPTRVFSAPSEHSQLVANVEPGTQVNVVDSRNGWLEIRSKHGRPPGFIQKTAAVRIGEN